MIEIAITGCKFKSGYTLGFVEYSQSQNCSQQLFELNSQHHSVRAIKKLLAFSNQDEKNK